MAQFLSGSWIFTVMMGGAAVSVLVDMLFDYPVRQLRDLVAVLRFVREEEIETLLDAEEEGKLRAGMSRREFREEQYTRMRRLFEYLRRMAFNGKLMLSLAYAEQDKLAHENLPDAVERAALIRETIEAGIEFRIYSVFALGKLSLWILLRADRWILLPQPSLSDLREVAQTNGLEAYSRLCSAVGYLSLHYGESSYRELMKALHGPEFP